MTEVDKMKLTKVGCFLNLQPFSCFLSVFGIVFSIIGTIGGYTAFVMGFLSNLSYRSVVYDIIINSQNDLQVRSDNIAGLFEGF